MKLGKVPRIFLALFLLFFPAQFVWAHSPYLERGKTEIAVENPEISKAYYGWLEGTPAIYSILSPKPFLLYVNLLSPRIDGERVNLSAKIRKNGRLIKTLDGNNDFWLVEYEPFANDYYLKGSEYEARVDAGDYQIEIYNSGSRGNYVLVLGKKEDLSFGEFLRTLVVLPKVKEEFFGKNAWQAYNNLMGLTGFILLVILAMVAYFTFSFFRRYRLKKQLDKEYGKHKDHRVSW